VPPAPPAISAESSLVRAYCRERGIPDAAADEVQLEGLSRAETGALGSTFSPVVSMRIPYFGIDGERTSFFRVRYLEEPPGWGALVEKPQRYAQAPGSLNEVYLPPVHDWAATASDPTVPLVLTEGEVKALAACVRGVPTIGLGGVDVWRSSRRGLALLPPMEDIDWARRRVCVLFDSDTVKNPNVVRAQRQLAEVLAAKGAQVSLLALPPAMDGSKVGLDDYLLTHSDADFQELLSRAPAWDESRRLWELNEEVTYIRTPGIILERGTGDLINYKDFVSHKYANRSYMEQRANASGTVTLVRKPLADRWIKWEARSELRRITYAPGKPEIHESQWNTWKGLGVEPAPGTVAPWSRLLDHLFGADKEARGWFEKWCAYPLQHPGTKLYTSVVMWGVKQGTGKTLIGYTLKRIYGKNAIEIKDTDLRGAFNDWAENKQFVVGDEVTGSDKRADADKLKGLITQDTMRVNKKFLPPFTIPDCINYFFTSNHPDAFFMDDDDRRSFVVNVEVDPLPGEFYREYDGWYKGLGASHLLHHLLSLDLAGFDPHAQAHRTIAREDMIIHARSDLSSWVHMLIEDPQTHLAVLGRSIAEGCDLFTSQQLLAAYRHANDSRGNNVTANGLGRELRRCGVAQVCKGQALRTHHGWVRLYSVRNDWRQASRVECETHYNGFFPAVPTR
jgi:hypothetical protein